MCSRTLFSLSIDDTLEFNLHHATIHYVVVSQATYSNRENSYRDNSFIATRSPVRLCTPE